MRWTGSAWAAEPLEYWESTHVPLSGVAESPDGYLYAVGAENYTGGSNPAILVAGPECHWPYNAYVPAALR